MLLEKLNIWKLLQRKCLFVVVLFCAFFFQSSVCLATSYQSDRDTTVKKNTLLAYPVAFHLPETGWGGGVAGFYNFRFNQRDSISPPSQLQLGFAYTEEKQVLWYLPFNLFWNNRLNNLSGEAGYYRYSYYYFGFGNEVTPGLKELYEVKFPRIRINYLRKVQEHCFVGGRYWYENYDIYSRQEDGELMNDNVPGGSGSVSSGPGLVTLYDSRDNIYQAFQGVYLELVYHNQSQIFGSDHWFDRYRFDFRKFFRTGKRQSIGVNFFGDFLFGSVPFSQMTSMGSAKRMRGYYEGRFRDKNLLLVQSEYRAMVWRKWGFVLFSNSGVVAETPGDFSIRHVKFSAGAGLRFAFDKEKRVNLRLDYALGKNSQAFYFTVGEAF